jgi:hypothetical protein
MERQASNACRQKMMADVLVGSGATKLIAANYLAFVQLASIRLWLRINESTS